MMFSLSTLVLVNLIGHAMAQEKTAVVNTSSSPVQGEICTSVHLTKYAAFKGIRFAEPPLGYLRFKHSLFYLFHMSANNYNLSLSDPVGLTIHRVATVWTNFAKYGDSTPHSVDKYPLDVTWPPSKKSGQALEIGNELKMVQRPIDSITELLQKLLRIFSPELNDCYKFLTCS